MALTDLFKELDPKLADVLDKTTQALRREFDEKLELAMSPRREVAAAEAVAVSPEPDAAPTETGARDVGLSDLLDPVEELKHAVTEIDACSSQGEILEALVAGCARFSSRVGIFLLRGGDAFGWGGHGFDRNAEEFKKIRLEIASAPSWAKLAGGSGAIALSAAECRGVTDLLSAEAPQMGILIPFVLGNQPAAAIYCDRLEDDPAPQISALQILTFIASQVLENLPVRDRDHTATLRLSSTGSPTSDLSGGAVALAAAGAAAAVVEPVDAVEAEVLPEGDEPAATHLPPISEPQPPVATVPESAPEPIEVEPEPVETEVSEEEVEEIGGFEPPASDPAAPRFEETPPLAPISAEPPAIEFQPESPVAPLDTKPAAGLDAPTGPTAVPSPVTGIAPPSSLPPVAPATPPAPAAAPPAPPTLGAESSTQVAPPKDVKGPGWAFTASPGAGGGESAESSNDEEARRLARLLVTEIKLYNEEQVEQGRLKGNVYSLLRDDIDRSRQIFEDRIDDEVRGTKDYFHEACVRILAGGDPAVLGF